MEGVRGVLCDQGGFPDHRAVVQFRDMSLWWTNDFAGLINNMGEFCFVFSGEEAVPGWNVESEDGFNEWSVNQG